MRGGQRQGDLGSGAKAGVNKAPPPQLVERFRVERGAVRLDDHIAVMDEAQPLQILENAVDKLWPASPGIQILDPQSELAASGPRASMPQRGGVGVAEMKPSRRRGGESCDLQDSLHAKGDIGDS